ncbi:unnamed protein product [Symbiodinium sp. CCMP2592]|nr:unnamed protein product [Symbiodinium sp. CCMP2592]
MNPPIIDASAASDEIRLDWTWERFTVVDAGNGEIALHNTFHNRFVRMSSTGMDTSGFGAADELPADSIWERFTVVDVGDGSIALHSGVHNRFISLSDDGRVGVSETKNASDLPAHLERFRLVKVKPYLEPGSTVALHCAHWNRFLRMNWVPDMDGSPEMNADALPSGWTWSYYTVVDAGHGKIALHNAVHNRFVRMNGAEMETSVPMASSDLPANSAGEAFAVRYFPTGGIALHNTFFNRYVRMTDWVVNSSDQVDEQDFLELVPEQNFDIVTVAEVPEAMTQARRKFLASARVGVGSLWSAASAIVGVEGLGQFGSARVGLEPFRGSKFSGWLSLTGVLAVRLLFPGWLGGFFSEMSQENMPQQQQVQQPPPEAPVAGFAPQLQEQPAPAGVRLFFAKALTATQLAAENTEEELRGRREWSFQLVTWLVAHDEDFEDDIVVEQFAIAAVSTDGPEIIRDGHHVPIWFTLNTLMLTAVVSAITAFDYGALPPEAEDAVQQPGWFILPSGLPLLTLHHVTEVSLESAFRETDDGTHMAMFVRKERVWVQVTTAPTVMFPSGGSQEEMAGFHDVAVLFHVEELPSDLREIFTEVGPDVGMHVPNESQEKTDTGAGVWAERDVAGPAPDAGGCVRLLCVC